MYLYQTRRIISDSALALLSHFAGLPLVDDELDAIPESESVTGVEHEPERGAADSSHEAAEDAGLASVHQSLSEPLDLRALTPERRHSSVIHG